MASGNQSVRTQQEIERDLLAIIARFETAPEGFLRELLNDIANLKSARAALLAKTKNEGNDQAVAQLEALAAKVTEAIKTTEVRARERQNTFLEYFLETVELRINGLASLGSHCEKLTVAGFAGVTASISLLGYLSQHSEHSGKPVVLEAVSAIVVSLVLQFGGLVSAMLGHQEIAFWTNQISQSAADQASAELRFAPEDAPSVPGAVVTQSNVLAETRKLEEDFKVRTHTKEKWARTSAILYTVALAFLLAFLLVNIDIFRLHPTPPAPQAGT